MRALIFWAVAALAGAAAPAEYRSVHLLPDPEARVVAVALRFPAGGADDPIGQEGRAALFGRVLQGSATDPLIGHGAQVIVEIGSQETLVVLLAAPDSWREALRELEALLYTRVPTQGEVDAAREYAVQVLQFEEGAPVRGFERERAFMLLGSASPAARPVTGSIGTVAGLQPSDLTAFRDDFIQSDLGAVSLTGPLSRDEVQAAFQAEVALLTLARAPPILRQAPAPSSLDSTGAPVARPRTTPPLPPAPVQRARGENLPPLRVPDAGAGTPAWSAPERIVLDRDLTSTWMAIGFPFPPQSPRFLLDFLAHLVSENLIRTPPDPGLFEAEVSVERIGEAPVVVISASVDPFRSAEWEGRLSGALDSLATAPPEGAFFELTRRRFRSGVLLDLALPENLVRWIAREVAFGRLPLTDPEVEIWRLRRDEVATAARAAGPPRTLVFGPQGLVGR